MTVQPFSKIPTMDDVYIARVGKLNCMAFGLKQKGVCLYSPVSGFEMADHDGLSHLGGVTAMLAPNHYHNKGLIGHANVFPDTPLHCSKGAAPRLEKLTQLSFEPLDALRAHLADSQKILEPPGLKTGEVWAQIEQKSEVAWIVTDAFSAALLAPGEFAPFPKLLGTFPRYGVKDANVFKVWLQKQIAISQPTLLLSCHGSPVRDKKLGSMLENLMGDLN